MVEYACQGIEEEKMRLPNPCGTAVVQPASGGHSSRQPAGRFAHLFISEGELTVSVRT
jgi:hypothetical protein